MSSSTDICTDISVPPGGPTPPRLWTRATGECPENVNNNPDFYQKLAERRKAEIFQYKNNSTQISKKQYYARIAKGLNYTGKKSWATQNQIYTNPNTSGLPQNGYNLSMTCSQSVKCAMSYQNNTPGPAIKICMDKSVPLYMYKLRKPVYPMGGKSIKYIPNPNLHT